MSQPHRVRQTVQMNQVAVGCILHLKPASESRFGTVRNKGVACDRSNSDWIGKTDKRFERDEEHDDTHWSCADWCRLDIGGFSHPAVIVKVDQIKECLSFVHATSTLFQEDRALQRSRNRYTPIGHIDSANPSINMLDSRYWIMVKEKDVMVKPTWMCLPHVYTLHVSHFETFDEGPEVKPFHKRLDRQSYENLRERLDWALLKQEYRSSYKLWSYGEPERSSDQVDELGFMTIPCKNQRRGGGKS